MSAHAAKQIRRRAKYLTEPRNLRLDGLGDWLKANETGHKESPRSTRNQKPK